MKKLVLFIINLACICNLVLAQHEDPKFVDGKLYFKLRLSDTTLSLSSPVFLPLVALYHMDSCYRPFAGLGNDSLEKTYCLRFSDTAKTKRCMDTLRSLPIVDYVERVVLHRTNYVPNDINSLQYAIYKINAEAAWSITKGSASVVVAIIDNGVLTTHQDLVANLVPGFDVADNDNNPNPPAGFSGLVWNHGTHCSGIASAATDNGVGIASIGFNTKIMPVKCTSDTSTSGDDISFADEGITYAMRSGAKVISMSFGSYQSSLTEQLLMSSAINQGIVLVAAAGNDDSSQVEYPAAYPGVICVGGTDGSDKKAFWSNYGSRIDVMAPGVNIFSTFATSTTSYDGLNGTSMSCPMVAGLAALVLAKNPSFTPAQVLSAIKNGADNIDAANPTHVNQLGGGRINAFHALGGIGTGIENIINVEDVKVFPNPFSNHIALHLSNTALPATIQLLDMQGRTVINEEISNQLNPEIETSHLSNGMYVVKVITNTTVISSKVVKM